MSLSPHPFCLPAIALLLASTASADTERGQALFENHCTGCHHPAFLNRPLRYAKDAESLDYFVNRWAGETQPQWTPAERADVVDYLNWRYYQFTLKP
jgi:mono/diheme cytochrome c family protein